MANGPRKELDHTDGGRKRRGREELEWHFRLLGRGNVGPAIEIRPKQA